MLRRLVALIALTGCASAPVVARSPAPVATDNQTLVGSLVREQEALSSELNHPGSFECGRGCELAGDICGDSARICALSDRDAQDPEVARACSDAADRCTQANLDVRSRQCICPPNP
jgi:hypothetical protein